MNIAPITICAAPTAGKAVLLALLEGNPSVFSTPLWHDNVSAALCKFVPLAQRVPNGLAEGIYGNNLQLKYFRDLLAETEYSRLESVSLQKFYIFHLSNNEQIRIPIQFDFYSMDRELAKTIWNMQNYNPENIFAAIFTALHNAIGGEETNKFRYALSMPYNDFRDYEELISTFPQGKVIYIDRDIPSALGSTILRRARLLKTSFTTECKNEFLGGDNNFLFELIHRTNKIQKLSIIYPEKILVVKFEEIILETEKTMRTICEWLSIPFTENMLRATFQGQIIDSRATGSIQDDMQKLLNHEEASLLHNYISYFQNSENGEYKFPAALFKTEHEISNDGNIIINPEKIDGNIFYGPYISIPPGSYEINFNFKITDLFSSLCMLWILDCIDTSGTCYFKKIVPVCALHYSIKFHFTVKNYNLKFEFRAYGKKNRHASPIIFEGVKIKKICKNESIPTKIIRKFFNP